jgi:hypothetical protein
MSPCSILVAGHTLLGHMSKFLATFGRVEYETDGRHYETNGI